MPGSAPQLVVIDTETTGLDPSRDRVVDIGAVRLNAALEAVESFTTLVDPERPLPLLVTRLTGIADRDVAGAPRFEQAFARLREFVGDSLVVGQNIAFDLDMLGGEAARCGAPPLRPLAFDTLQAALLLYPELDHHALDHLAAVLGLAAPTHRALIDAQVTAGLFARLCARAAALTPDERRLLDSAGWEPLRALDSFNAAADQPPSSPAGTRGHGDGPAGALDADRASAGDRPDVLACAAGGWRHAFAADGPLAERLHGFAVRSGQVDLAAEAAGLLEAGGLGLLEAGTGMGKSLAYLLPAAYHAAATGARVVVTTKTKALQRQLAERELPLVASCLPPGWRWTLLMGRENYLCKRRLDEAVAGSHCGLPERDRLLALSWLLGRSRYGAVDLSSLPYGATQALPALARTAREVRSSSAACLGHRCAVRADCHWRKARAEAQRAHLVCVNHALLLTGADTLPPFDDLIVDEAHLLPDEAVSAFTDTVDQRLVDELLGEARGARGHRPLAAVARTAARKLDASPGAQLAQAGDVLERSVRDLPGLAADVDAALGVLAQAAAPDDASADDATDATGRRDGGRSQADGYGRSLLITPGLQQQPAFDAFAVAADTLAATLSELAAAAAATADALSDTHRERPRAVTLSVEAATASRLLGGLTAQPPPDMVTWAELPPRRGGAAGFAPAWSLSSAPLSPAPLVRERLWDRLRSAVLVSATLGVAGSFAYFREQAGLSPDLDVRERVFASPFDYRRQAALVLEHDPSTPYSAGEQPARLAARLRRLTDITGGRLLALFTNKREVEQVTALVGPHVEDDGVVVLAQGVHGGAAALAEEFRSHPATVLLGVDALWTGQDFPGDALVCLVIARLPFPRQDARFEARRRAAQSDGRDWFRSFYLPEAVLRFRQGFGRLIRTETDAGVVVVLDHRLTQKTYLREFLASLPEIGVVRAAPDDVAPAVAEALARLGALAPAAV